MLKDHRKLRRAPQLVLSDRVQQRYPALVANVVERMFRIDNPGAEAGSAPHPPGRAASRRRAGSATWSATRYDGWRSFG